MRGDRFLLDCTLRDGGYINDWEFGHDKILELFKRLVSSNVDFIEIGFIDDRRILDLNRTIMPDTEAIDKIFSGLNKGNAKIVGMIDYGTCDIKNIKPCKESFIDGIRVIFKQHVAKEALSYCEELKKLGYLVFCQMVSATTYSDDDLVEYSNMVNKLMPYANSIVDTYGLMDGDKLMHILNIIDSNLDSSIKIGYHAHNNFQLGFSNAVRFLSSSTQRDLLVDGSMFGMGKSAGNAPIELLMMYMNEKYNHHYDINQILEGIDNVILGINEKQDWGYNLRFYISSYTKCHPNYISFFMDKRTLSVKQIIDILNNLEFSKKLMYDSKYAEQKYIEYQNIICNDVVDSNKLRELFSHKNILLIGPGKNIEEERQLVDDFFDNHDVITISVNYVPRDIAVDYIFLTKSKRYTQVLNELEVRYTNNQPKIIATSNVMKTEGAFDFVLNYRDLIDPNTEIIDNSLVMILKVLALCHVRDVYLAGFDGYSKIDDNYFDIRKEYSYVRDKADYLNSYVKEFLVNIQSSLRVHFITSSKYKN